MRRASGWFFLAVLFAFQACSPRPSREKFPGPQGRTTDMGAAKVSSEVLGGFDPNAKFTQVESDDAVLGGIAEVTAGLNVPQRAFVFVSARPLAGGPPLAVARFAFAQSPFRFALTSANKMLADTKFEGMVELSIRIDQDADPLSRTAGDLFGQTTVRVGAQNLRVKIDGIISKDGEN